MGAGREIGKRAGDPFGLQSGKLIASASPFGVA